MGFEGKIYRPWPEANSLLIQVTLGCTTSQRGGCTFCNMFRDKRFRIKERGEIFDDIAVSRTIYPYVRSVFLIDGNVMVLKTELLLEVIQKVKETFPECDKISLYAGLEDLRRKPVEELRALKEAGLSMAYVGLESGDALTLERIRKGITPEQALEGMAHAKAAGIDVLLSIILGIGGKERSREHIVATTELLNQMKPEEIAPMVLAIQPGTELEAQVEAGDFVQATPQQILEEERYLLEHLEGFETVYWGDHGNNILTLRGKLPSHRQTFLEKVNAALEEHPSMHQDVLQATPW